jgi:prenylcysteine oxidase / farnesylcysteine lyase
LDHDSLMLESGRVMSYPYPWQVITRINYGQGVRISGLAGAVSLAGSESGLWAVKGGNWQLAAGLLKASNSTLHLQEGIDSITDAGDYYVLKSNIGNEYNCTVTVVATPLDEVNITFSPPISIPPRKMQHTHTTFVRGLLNHVSVGTSLLTKTETQRHN